MPHEFLSKMQADLEEPDRTRKLNRELFTLIAPQYDHATRYLSLGRDSCWKDQLAADLPLISAPVCLDLACGTGDLTRRLAAKYPDGTVMGLDLTEAMLAKARQLGHPSNLRYMAGDMGHIGLPDDSVDIVTGGYALRNAGDLHEVLREIHRILKPGGIAVFLDFSKPANSWGQHISHAILKIWGGIWGWILHRDPRVYTYIADSLSRYPDRRQLASVFHKAGLEELQTRYAFLGLIERRTVEKRTGHPGNREFRRLTPQNPRMEAQTIAIALKIAMMVKGSGWHKTHANTPQVSTKKMEPRAIFLTRRGVFTFRNRIFPSYIPAPKAATTVKGKA